MNVATEIRLTTPADAALIQQRLMSNPAVLERVRKSLDADTSPALIEDISDYVHYMVKVRRKDGKRTTICMRPAFLAACLTLTGGDIVKVRRAAKVAALSIDVSDGVDVFSVRARARMLKLLQNGSAEWL